MNKITKDLIKIALAEKPEIAVKEIIDEKKRGYTLGLGSLLATLGACSAPVDPNARAPQAPQRASSYEPANFSEVIGVNADDQLLDDEDDPADGNPGSPPPTGTVPVIPDPSPNPAPIEPAPTNPVAPDPAPTNPAPVDPTPAPAPVDPAPMPAPSPAPVDPAPAPAPSPAPVDPVPSISAQTFTALGPGMINIDASDMMDPNNIQTMSDGNSLIVWGFSNSGGASFNGDLDRLCPGPVIEAIEGESTIVALRSQMPHTIHFHGLDVDQANDGVPSTSGYVSQMNPSAPGGIPFQLQPIFSRLASTAVPLGNPYGYRFIPPHAGTFLYHCHVDTILHMEMGMSGTVIVRPPDGSKNTLWLDGPIFDREYIWQLHTFDSTWHIGPAISGAANTYYNPDYFMINGRDGMDILADPTAAIEALTGQQIVIRLVNLGYQPAIVSLGGIPFDVLASDGRPVKKLFLDLFTEMMIAPGERYDIMFTMPATGVTNTSVDYLDIMGRNILGSAVSSITSL